MTQSAIPSSGLVGGLQALAQESHDAQARRVLQDLAKSVATGAALPQAITDLPTAPAHLTSLLRSAGERGSYSLLLAQIAAGEHRARRITQTASRGLIYPILLLVACAALTLAFSTYVLSPLHELLVEFELRLPRYVYRMRYVTLWGSTLILSVSGVLVVVAATVRLIGGRRSWGWFVSHLPLIGRNYHWAGVIEWLELLRLLVETGRPLPEALREAARGVRDGYVGAASERVATRVAAGLPFWQAYSQEYCLPAALWPFLRIGEERRALPAALEGSAEVLYGRLQMRVQMLNRWVPVLIICLAALLITWIVMGVFAPMLGLIQGLSGGGGGGGFSGGGDTRTDSLPVSVLFIPGVAVFIAHRLLQRRDITFAGAQVDRLLKTLAWMLMFVGAMGLVIAVSGGIVFLPALIAGYLAIEAFIYTRRSQHRALLWTLAIAARQHVPFPDALRAISEDELGTVAPYARRFADALERGEPLDAAARKASLWLPRELRVALAWSGRTGLVADALEQSLTADRTATRELQKTINFLAYFWALLAAMLFILTFIMLKIVPVFAKMFEEFELKLPMPTLLLIECAKAFVSYWYLGFLPAVFAIGLTGIMLIDVNFGLFFVAQHVWPFSRLMRRYWGANLLHLLAPAMRRGFPIDHAFEALAESHPLFFVRYRLQRAVEEFRKGQSIWQALARRGFISKTEAAVLMAAERVGNLAWALDEMADRILRRHAYWLRSIYNIAIPMVVVSVAGVVAFVVISLFIPLVALIQGMAGR